MGKGRAFGVKNFDENWAKRKGCRPMKRADECSSAPEQRHRERHSQSHLARSPQAVLPSSGRDHGSAMMQVFTCLRLAPAFLSTTAATFVSRPRSGLPGTICRPRHHRTTTTSTTIPRACAAESPADPGIDAIVSATRYIAHFTDDASGAIPVDLVDKDEWDNYLSSQSPPVRAWLAINPGAPSAPTPIPNFDTPDGSVARFVAPVKSEGIPLWRAAAALAALPKGRTYAVDRSADFSHSQLELAWALAAYSFTRYKAPEKPNVSPAVLVRVTAPESKDRTDVDRAVCATYMVRDMISTPAEDFGPASLEAAVSTLAAKHAARSSSIVGSQLLRLGYPQVHCVGRAASAERAPRLLELLWNERADRVLTLVGKGVCYDTGGLSMKPTSSMITMQKDMGGAAQVLGLADMIMDAGLDVRLRVLIPAVENNVDATSYRPGDVLTARNGKTTLNMNSDAEGRLILADALVAAAEGEPDLIIDCATLTGAQRVALGPDIPSIFCTDDNVADRLFEISQEIDDLVWRLPLHAPYRRMLETPLADIKSCSSGGHGGAITAALYLKEFVGDSNWIHVDMMAYNTASTPGRPEGGEAMGMRALFEYIRQRYS